MFLILRLLLSVLLISSFAGCVDPNSAYERGRAKGAEEQKAKSYDEAYEAGHEKGYKEAVDRLYPGTPGNRPSWLRGLYAFFVVLGTVLIVGTSLRVLYVLVFQGENELHGLARLIMVGLGILVSFWLDSVIGILGYPGLVSDFRSFLLSPAPPTLVGQILTVCVFTLITLLFVHFCFTWIDRFEDRYAIALMAFMWTVYICFLIFLTVELLGTPDVAQYRLFPVSVGCICGYGFRLVFRLLKQDPARKKRSKPSPE